MQTNRNFSLHANSKAACRIRESDSAAVDRCRYPHSTQGLRNEPDSPRLAPRLRPPYNADCSRQCQLTEDDEGDKGRRESESDASQENQVSHSAVAQWRRQAGDLIVASALPDEQVLS